MSAPAGDQIGLIANARMYAVTPQAGRAWSEIFKWLARTTGLPLIERAHPPPAPISALWSREGLGCVFMCGWPLIERYPDVRLLAAPVPMPDRYQNRPIYFTDFVVHRDSAYRSLEDTFGGTIGWTLEDSNSGYNLPRHHLLRYRGQGRERLYARSVGNLINPLGSLRAVAEGHVDVAPVDSFCHDLFEAAAHPYAELTRTVETTEPSPIPALVASSDLSEVEAERIGAALLEAHSDPTIASALEAALIRRFIRPQLAQYEYTRGLALAAESAGYLLPH